MSAGRTMQCSGAALMIIDMQEGMAQVPLSERNNPGAEARIGELLDHWRALGAPVVHVRHLSPTPGSPFWPGQSGVEFQVDFAPREGEYVVEKKVPDAFVNTGLEHCLRQRGVESLVIVGVSTSNSVEATARSAGNLGFRTYVASDATFTFPKRDFNGVLRTADEVHAMSLANLNGEYALIKSSEQLKVLAGRPR